MLPETQMLGSLMKILYPVPLERVPDDLLGGERISVQRMWTSSVSALTSNATDTLPSFLAKTRTLHDRLISPSMNASENLPSERSLSRSSPRWYLLPS